MSAENLSDTTSQSRFAPELDDGKLKEEATAQCAAKLLYADSLVPPGGNKSKRITEQKVLADVQDMDAQLEKYSGNDPAASYKLVEAFKDNIENNLTERKLLGTFLKAEPPMSAKEFKEKLHSTDDGHHVVEHCLLTLADQEGLRTPLLYKTLPKLNPLTWLDKYIEQNMYGWFIIRSL